MSYLQISFFYKHSFNRYMVECEFRYMSMSQCSVIVLIDTWWNVNVRDEIIFDLQNQF